MCKGYADGVIYALSIHADYRCRRSGVCCTSDWDVPVELPLYRNLEEALASGQLIPAAAPADDEPVFVQGPDLPDAAAAMVSRTPSGDCVFYHRGSGLCVVHRDLGEASLPATCRHFPRLAVLDARGTFISLSHYCPTAASMLFRDDVPLAIVESPAAFPPAEYDGLRVGSDAWPPLLHPRMLMNGDTYSAWERHMVERCADPALAPEAVIATLERDARLLRTYRPGSQPLDDAIAQLPRTAVDEPEPVTLAASLALYAEAIGAAPEEWKPKPDEERLEEVFELSVAPEWRRWRWPLKRYVAAKAFASWTAYQGRGLLTIVRGLEAALALVRVEASRRCRDLSRTLDGELLCEAIRQADFLLNHLAVAEELAEAWSRVEDDF
jgi:hypothetical protein